MPLVIACRKLVARCAALRLALLIVIAISLASCRSKSTDESSSARDGRPVVFVTNYPLQYFAEQIAGDALHVQFPAPSNVDPAFWHPSSDVIQQYQQADLILTNGAGYEHWMETVSLAESRVVNTSAEFQDRYLRVAEAIVHKHGPEGEHAHEGLASLTWLDPQQARTQAHVVYEALAKLAPERQQEFADRWKHLDGELAKLEQELQAAAGEPQQPMYASHPVYDYLARFCQWNLESMHWEPDETPDEAQWQKFASLHEQHQARFMLWEAPPTDETRRRLEDDFQVQCIVYYPCGNRPAAGDLLSTMQDNVGRLRDAMGKTD